jgi:hypothetical protein
MSSIPPHGRKCAACRGTGQWHTWGPCESGQCEHCHGTGRVCPGGPVRAAVHMDTLYRDKLTARSASIYICQTCHSVVNPDEVKHD